MICLIIFSIFLGQDVLGLVGEVDWRTKPHGLMRKAGNVPLGILVADNLPNVIVDSAKNPSTAFTGMIRGQPGCLVLGQGAGVAASEAVKQKIPVHSINIQKVHKELKKQNILLEI